MQQRIFETNNIKRKINFTKNMLIALNAIQSIETPFRLSCSIPGILENIPRIAINIGKLKYFGLVNVYENRINDRYVKFYKISESGQRFLHNDEPCSCYVIHKHNFWEDEDYSYITFSKEKKLLKNLQKYFN